MSKQTKKDISKALELDKARFLDLDDLELIQLVAVKNNDFKGIAIENGRGFLLDLSVLKTIHTALGYYIDHHSQDDIDNFNSRLIMDELEREKEAEKRAEEYNKRRAEGRKGFTYIVKREEGYKFFYVNEGNLDIKLCFNNLCKGITLSRILF